MIIFNVEQEKEKKSADKLSIGDVLQRQNDNFYYQIDNITTNLITRELSYHFYGFVIKGMKNLKNHFKNDAVLFNVF